ncbi:hypothetical protein AAH678_11420 [Sodalis endosymbiont of Spalangia cameroni]|uniref:DUF7146 domain-containing protein n=1 Tax=Sodalis praecaptivus TaxID=1239307 RepID=UPI0031F830B4
MELTQGKDFKTLAREIDQLIGNSYDRTRQPSKPNGTQETRSKVISKFSTLHPLRETTAQQYLASRGIHELPSNHVRFNFDEKTPWGNKQAIWSIATDDKGNACYLHRTILDGTKKAEFEGAKRMLKLQEESYLGFAGSVAIRMFQASSTLGVAEGIPLCQGSCRL